MLAPHRKYKSALQMVVAEVDKALRQVSQDKSHAKKDPWAVKQLWKVSELDSARLTKLLVWGERYGVTTEYILEVILGFYYSTLPKLLRVRAKSSRALGIRISSLVSDLSHTVLCEHLEYDFPDGSNLAAFKEEEKERIAELLDPDELPRKSRGVLQHDSIDSFVKAYTRQMEVRRTGVSRIDRKMKKLAWRGNPWR